jgi:hypothetical protein
MCVLPSYDETGDSIVQPRSENKFSFLNKIALKQTKNMTLCKLHRNETNIAYQKVE